MNQQERDQAAYALAKEYFSNLNIEGVTPQLIEKYLCLSETKGRQLPGAPLSTGVKFYHCCPVRGLALKIPR